MKKKNILILIFFIFFVSVGAFLLFEGLTLPSPTKHLIHIQAFRYGTSPSIIRARRGDKLVMTFSTEDTGHSFFLQEYKIDAKISPSSDMVELYDPYYPSAPTSIAKDIRVVAGLPGFWGGLFSLSRFRCHVYCGRMHGFEQGSLIVRPNWLFALSLGLILAISLAGYVRVRWGPPLPLPQSGLVDLNRIIPLLDKFLKWRPLQFVLTMPVLGLFILLIMAGFFGTKVGGRNIAVMLTWATWMFFMTVLLVPVGGRIWCLICPLPAPGEYLQRGATTEVRTLKGTSKNRSFGLNLSWPKFLSNPWIRIISFLMVGSFSASLAGQPKWTAAILLLFVLLAVIISLLFARRSFCMYVCPVSTFLSLYSPIGRLMVQPRDAGVCKKCPEKFCFAGNEKGWGCPFGLLVPAIKRNTDCGLCTECFKSCPYDNVMLAWRKGALSNFFKNQGEAFQAVAMFTLAIAYSMTIHSPWPKMRDLVNIVDKASWFQFGSYVVILWLLSLVIMPGLVWMLTRWGVIRAHFEISNSEAFKIMANPLIPMGLCVWAAFFVAMFMPNVTFILITLSDPFGWGWNIFGTAGIPWIQLWPQFIPWIQAALIISGLFFSLRYGYKNWLRVSRSPLQALRIFMPFAIFLICFSTGLAIYFTNF